MSYKIKMTELVNFIQNMPKAEIHIHFEGSIQPATVLKLAERHGELDSLPGNSVQALEKWFTFTDFTNFIQIYVIILEPRNITKKLWI
jgi:adenosine deaminase